ncbi:MAG: BRO-N domain-containing protein, partial [Cetobacterium sp.]
MSNNNENTAQIAAGPEWPRFNAQNLEHLNKILTYNNKSVRIFGTNENPWFCGRDVCEILEYENYRNALFKFVDDEHKKSLKDLGVLDSSTPKISHNQGQMSYINEAGLYSLIFACKLPLAKLFRKWVMEEVLPSIRKTGQYKLQEQLADAMKNLEIKDKELKDAKSKLRSETSKLKEQLKK